MKIVNRKWGILGVLNLIFVEKEDFIQKYSSCLFRSLGYRSGRYRISFEGLRKAVWLFLFQKYEGDSMLIGYDPFFKFGENFYLALTEEAKERILKVGLIIL